MPAAGERMRWWPRGLGRRLPFLVFEGGNRVCLRKQIVGSERENQVGQGEDMPKVGEEEKNGHRKTEGWGKSIYLSIPPEWDDPFHPWEPVTSRTRNALVRIEISSLPCSRRSISSRNGNCGFAQFGVALTTCLHPYLVVHQIIINNTIIITTYT